MEHWYLLSLHLPGALLTAWVQSLGHLGKICTAGDAAWCLHCDPDSWRGWPGKRSQTAGRAVR